MEYEKRNAEKSDGGEEEEGEGERTERNKRIRASSVDFRHAVFYSGVHSCAYLDVIRVCMYTVSSRVRRNYWSRKFLLSAQALKFMSCVLSLSFWSTFLLLSMFFFFFFFFLSFVLIFLFFLALVSVFRNGGVLVLRRCESSCRS